MLCLTSFAVAIVTLSDVRTPTLVIDVDAIARDRSLEQLEPVALTCAAAALTLTSLLRTTVRTGLRHRAARPGARVRTLTPRSRAWTHRRWPQI